MDFFQIYIQALFVIIVMMTILWLFSIILKNVSIVDPFWGMGFIVLGIFYYINAEGFEIRKLILLSFLLIWGLRLSIYLGWRNRGKGEDFRYRKFREDYGVTRYWWISFFQTFLLQGILLWLISAPLLSTLLFTSKDTLNILDYCAIVIWVVGFIFEAGGDFQLAHFKSDVANKGKLLTSGLWKFTRHPNYFGDAMVWWGFGIFSLASGGYVQILSSVLMTFLIIKVSGVRLLEKTLVEEKPDFKEYIEKTNAFFPWFPKK